MSKTQRPIPPDAVAVIGMSGRFPKAADLDTLWENLKNGREGISFFGDEELAAAEFDFDAVKDNPNFVKARGILEGVDLFDASFFGFRPREAEALDPQQRFWFECAWAALEDAGCAPDKYEGSIGVFGGGGYLNTYLLHNLCRNREYIERLVRLRATDAFQAIISNDKDFLPTRTSYMFNLTGPSVNVQTACSTSLVAVAQACQSLLNFECDVCLAGGISIQLPQVRGYLSQEGGMDSSDGHARVFDARASGTVFSNGVGVVVLKRLEDALADRDSIRAVILGTAVNNDGANKISYIAPNMAGQAEVIAMAHENAGIDPRSISYIEAHGTATQLGDPIELEALTRAFRLKTDDRQFCGIGSIKSNVGHLDSAAGIAGLIKTVLALQHHQIPPSINFDTPNPEIRFDDSPFYVTTTLQDWQTDNGPLRAGVSSFGVGGTNAHVVMEEAPATEPSSPSRDTQLLLLSAKTETALEKRTEALAHYLQEKGDDVALADVAFTLQTGRKDMEHRRALVCRDGLDALAGLGDKQRCMTAAAPSAAPAVVFMFPGQGAQHVGMTQGLYEREATYKEHLDKCCEILKPKLDCDLRDIIFASQDDAAAAESLKQTSMTQPALFAVEYALAQLWMSWGVTPAALIGHSVGDYVAAALAGVFSLEDGLALIAERGRLMQAQPPGRMLAVRISEEELLPYLAEPVSLAAGNAPKLSVATGSSEAIEALEKRLADAGIGARALHTSHAFHSAMMDPVLEPFTECVAATKRMVPRIPFISGLTGTWITDDEATDPTYWAQQLRQAVRFSAGIRTLQTKPRLFLEVGPGKTLSTLAMQHPDKEHAHTVVSSMGHVQEKEPDVACMLQALGRLWQQNVAIDWAGFYAGETRNRLALPTYPFERKRYWVDPPSATPPTEAVAAPAPAEPVIRAAPEPAEPQVAVVDTGTRRDRIYTKLKTVLSDLSGIDFEDSDAATTFLEMGMDSLFLTQVSTELQNTLGVKIKFRQLLEDVNTLNILTDYFEEQLPADAFAAPAAAPVAPTSAQVPVAAPGTPMEQMQQQIAAMTRQLEAMSTGAAPTPAAPPPTEEAEDEKPRKPFGAQTRIDTTRKDDLTAKQRASLNRFIERYVARTRKSKAFTQYHREHLADPRAVSGFVPALKELTYPLVVERSKGSRVWDIDGNEYVDMINGFGACLFGHEPPFIIDAIEKQLHLSIEVGPQHLLAGEVAELMKAFTGLDRSAYCNTGSEAVMGAMRIARTVTGRKLIAIFTNSYHGIHDEVLVRGTKKLKSLPAAPGVPPEKVENVLVLDYGSRASLDVLKTRASELAAIMVEPVQSRDLDLQPREFLHELRRLTQDCGAAFIMDEVINGFRTCPGGAQEYFGVKADIATYGKVIGGGMPIGAIAGIPRFMDALDGGFWQFGDDSFPAVGVTYFAGTFVRHPLVMAAAKAVLLHLKEQGPQLQRALNDRMAAVVDDLHQFLKEVGAPIHLPTFSSSHQFRYTEDVPYGALLWPWMRAKGVHVWEGRTWFITTAHTEADIQFEMDAFKETVRELQEAEFLPSRKAIALGALPGGRERWPLTEAQQEIWFASQMSAGASCAYNESFNLHLWGPLDLAVMREAVQTVYQRHEAIHLRFSPNGDYQYQTEPEPIQVPFHDFSKMEEAKKNESIADMVRRDAVTPFDLENGPLLHVKILKAEAEHYIFLSTAHHIVFDGWSAGVFLEEVAIVYSALAQGEPYELPQAPRFTDYVEKEKRSQETEEGRHALQYWIERFTPPPAPLNLPADRSRPPLKTYQGGTVHWQSSRELYDALKQVAKAQGTTLYSTLLAGYGLLLYRLSGQDDLVIGIPVAGQSVVGEDGLIGHCVNLLPLRTRCDAEMSVKEFLAQTKRDLLDAQEHQHCTFGAILQNIDIERDPSRSPLVEVVFNLNRDLPGHGLHGLRSRIQENRKRFTNWDMFFNIDETEHCLTMDLDYNADIFDEATIQRWIGHFETVLAAVAAQPDLKLDAVPLMTEEQRAAVTNSWSRSEDLTIPDKCLHQLFESQVRKTPEATALIDGDRRMSYDALNRRANQVARCLKEAGVGSEQPVGVCLGRSADMIIGLLGILKSGGAYVPLDPAYPAERLAFILDDTQAPVVLTEKKLADALPDGPYRQFVIDAETATIDRQKDSNPRSGSRPDRLAYLIYTSGSTGRPKGVAIEHRNAVALLAWAKKVFPDEEIAGVLASTSICFDLSVFEIFVPLCRGGAVVLAENILALPELKAADEVTLVNTVPSAVAELIRAAGLPRSVKVVNLAGEALEPALVDAVYDAGAVQKVYDLYGPSEDTTYSTYALRERGGPATIGRPIANTRAYILDASLRQVPTKVPGELYLGGAGLARGYHNRPELTAARFVPNPFTDDPADRLYRTGDLARFRPDGNIEFLGRMDYQVKIRGYRIELGEIESVLKEHPSIREGVVVAGVDGAGGKTLCAYVVSTDAALVGSDVQDHLLNSLPQYMVPGTVIFLDALPLTPNGKIDRKALPVPQPQRRETKAVYVAPKDAIELHLTQLWEKLLNVRTVGLNDNFFDLGGHSLLAVRMVVEIERVYGRHLPLATLFQAPTIEQLAAILRKQDYRASWSSLVPIREGGSRPPLFLMHSHGGNVLEYYPLAERLDDQPVYALQARGLDGAIVEDPRLEEMAAHYIREIKGLQPGGPYFLAGFCFGGLLAYEVAQQLQADGDEVALLAMIQTPSPDYPEYAPGVTIFHRAYYGLTKRLDLELSNLSTVGVSYLLERARRVLDVVQARATMMLRPRSHRYGGRNDHNSLAFTLEALSIEHDKAYVAYQPKEYDGKVLLLPASKQPKGIKEDHTLGWGKLLNGALTVTEVPGHQQNLLREPNVSALAEKLNAALAEAQGV